MPRRRPNALPLLRLLPLIALACAQPEPEAPAPVRVESPRLGFAVAALPEPFTVAVNDADALVLEAPGGGRLRITIGPEQTAGINLVNAVKERRAAFEQAPGGAYLGNRELGTPIGPAFTARGTYNSDSGPVEETWVYAVHPSVHRLLSLAYTYPIGESEARVQQLLAVLGEIEGIGLSPS